MDPGDNIQGRERVSGPQEFFCLWQSLYPKSCLYFTSWCLWKTSNFSFVSPAAAEAGLGDRPSARTCRFHSPCFGSPQGLTIFQKHRKLLPILFQLSSPGIKEAIPKSLCQVILNAQRSFQKDISTCLSPEPFESKLLVGCTIIP